MGHGSRVGHGSRAGRGSRVGWAPGWGGLQGGAWLQGGAGSRVGRGCRVGRAPGWGGLQGGAGSRVVRGSRAGHGSRVGQAPGRGRLQGGARLQGPRCSTRAEGIFPTGRPPDSWLSRSMASALKGPKEKNLSSCCPCELRARLDPSWARFSFTSGVLTVCPCGVCKFEQASSARKTGFNSSVCPAEAGEFGFTLCTCPDSPETTRHSSVRRPALHAETNSCLAAVNQMPCFC